MSDEPRKGSLLVIFLTVFIDLLGFGIVLPLVPIYAADFAEDPHGWRLGIADGQFLDHAVRLCSRLGPALRSLGAGRC